MYTVARIINTLFSLYELLILVYVVLSWVRPAANRWTVLLDSIVEPVLTPIRNFLSQHLPTQLRFIDFSPWVAMLLLNLLRRLILNLLIF